MAAVDRLFTCWRDTGEEEKKGGNGTELKYGGNITRQCSCSSFAPILRGRPYMRVTSDLYGADRTDLDHVTCGKYRWCVDRTWQLESCHALSILCCIAVGSCFRVYGVGANHVEVANVDYSLVVKRRETFENNHFYYPQLNQAAVVGPRLSNFLSETSV